MELFELNLTGGMFEHPSLVPACVGEVRTSAELGTASQNVLLLLLVPWGFEKLKEIVHMYAQR